MNLSSLQSLQERVRSATGPSRELDLAVARALLPAKQWTLDWPLYAPFFVPDHFTTYPEGIGACVGLMNEVLPGCRWGRGPSGHFHIFKSVGGHHFDQSGFLRVRANDCLTFIDAIISAVLAQQEATHKEKA